MSLWLAEEYIYPYVSRRRKPRWPLDGDVAAIKAVNDVNDPENTRRLHGTDPLQDGWDPGEDPIRPYKRIRFRTPRPY